MVKQTLTIVHTEASVSWGGQGLRILREALWMRDRGHRVVIIAPAHSRLTAEAQSAGIETRAQRFTKRTQAVDLLKLVGYLRRLTPDVLNTHSSVDTWVGCLAGRLCRVPAIIRTRHLGAPVHTHLLNRWLYGVLCHHIVTTGEGISRALITGLRLNQQRVTTISTGICPPAVLPSPEDARLSFVKALHLPPTARFIGCLAVLRGGKGHVVLLKAFQKIYQTIPDYHLLIIGDGRFRRSLEDLIAQWRLQNRVHLTGYLADPWLALRALDVHVLASTSNEGTPQAILQAQFAGCPVIGSQCGGISEVITPGRTGLLVPKGEVEPLSTAILRLIGDRSYAAFLSRNAYQYVSQHHTLDLMGQKVLSVYRALLAAGI
jgi:glycosyltransferase involved in cell wall biosynthesis